MTIDASLVRNPSTIITGSTRLLAGSYPGSFTPTMAEVNASTHFNQAFALYNRRAYQCQIVQSTQAYITGLIDAFHIVAIRTKINNLRNQMGLSNYTWTNPCNQNDKIRKVDLDDLFSALNFTSVHTSFGIMSSAWRSGLAFSVTTENPRYSFDSIDEDATGVYAFCSDNSNRTPPGGPYQNIVHRGRAGFGFVYPNWNPTYINGSTNCIINVNFSSWHSGLSSFLPQMYQSSGDYTSAPSGWASHTDTDLGTAAYGASVCQWTVPSSNVNANYGTTKSYIVAPDSEFRDDFSDASLGTNNYNGMNGGSAYMTIDLGF